MPNSDVQKAIESSSVLLTYDESILTFDGVDDYVEVKDPFANNTEFTISLWVKSAIVNDGGWHGFIGKQGDNDQFRKPGLWLCPDKEGLHYDSYDLAGTRYGEMIENFFQPDKWVHVSWVKQGKEYKFYRNGYLVATKPAPEKFYSRKESSYWIGRADNFWNGQIAEVQIWSIARSQEQIQQDIYRRPVANKPGLGSYWYFSEGSGNVATDKTGRGNHGKIVGATWKPQVLKAKSKVLRDGGVNMGTEW